MTESRGEVGRFTDRLRQELSRLPPGPPAEMRAELSALLRVGGWLHLTGSDADRRLTVELQTTSGAVARRTFSLLQAAHRLRPELRVQASSGVRRTTYAVVVGPDSAPQLALDLSLVDSSGRLTDRTPDEFVDGVRLGAAYARGALLAGGSVSAPNREPHAEIAVRRTEGAEQLAEVLRRLVDHTVSVGQVEAGYRVVLKSRDGIGQLLAAVGAGGAFLAWEEQRLRRQLRNEAQRLANADAANVRRAVEAAAAQTAAVERAIRTAGWDGLAEDLREVALARLANPAASLAEIGELCDPPIGKSAVHRRLRRLEQIAEESESGTAD